MITLVKIFTKWQWKPLLSDPILKFDQSPNKLKIKLQDALFEQKCLFKTLTLADTYDKICYFTFQKSRKTYLIMSMLQVLRSKWNW